MAFSKIFNDYWYRYDRLLKEPWIILLDNLKAKRVLSGKREQDFAVIADEALNWAANNRRWKKFCGRKRMFTWVSSEDPSGVGYEVPLGHQVETWLRNVVWKALWYDGNFSQRIELFPTVSMKYVRSRLRMKHRKHKKEKWLETKGDFLTKSGELREFPKHRVISISNVVFSQKLRACWILSWLY